MPAALGLLCFGQKKWLKQSLQTTGSAKIKVPKKVQIAVIGGYLVHNS
jgi:hypothetical protein